MTPNLHRPTPTALAALRGQCLLALLPAGVYLVRLTTDGGLVQTQRLTLVR